VSDVVHHSVAVPASTANLGAGFDAFGLALSCYLGVRSVPRAAQDARVVLEGDGAAALPTGDDNLIWRSFVAACDHVEVPVPDVAIRGRTDIPSARGLGSSSAAIVAGLVLARALTGARVGDRELVALGAQLEGHPDNVAPALLGGLVACGTADDGSLVVRRSNPTPALRPIVLVPATPQATAAARAVLPAALSRAEVAEQAARAAHVLAALQGAWPADPRLAGDRLHEPARTAVMPPSGVVLDTLRAAGVHAWLSGAGSAVAAVIDARAPLPSEVTRVAREQAFAVHEVVVDLAGALACPDGGCAVAGVGGCARCPRTRL
jgi:homoserine kinase